MALSTDENNWRYLGMPEACKFCKGTLCCQYNACTTSPQDFDGDPCQMRNALLSGNYSIDLVRSPRCFRIENGFLTLNFDEICYNPEEAFYIRAKNVGCPTVDIIHVDDKAYGPCVFWNPKTGCKLSYENRPKFGRTLVPMPLGECFDYYDQFTSQGLRGQISKEWKPYHNNIMGMLYEFCEKGKIYPMRGLPPFKLI